MKKTTALLVGILLLAAGLRFWNLTVPDLISDDALYSFRAFGWFDFMGGGQTAPIQWFDKIPGWANLSFHDGPPLVLAIQKIFFVIFGNNTLAARLPFALAGITTVYLLYLLVKELRSKSAALLAAFLLAISSLHIWASHFGYLEGVETFFLVLTVWLFVKFIKTRESKFLYWWGASLGLALMTKYTAIFLLPVFVIYLLVFERPLLKSTTLWLSALIFIISLAPIIFYNIAVFQTRGHFDASLSSIVGMQPKDFSSVAGRAGSVSYFTAFEGVTDQLIRLVSWPVLILFIISFLFLLMRLLMKNQLNKQGNLLAILNFLLALAILIVGDLESARFVPIIMPWLIVIIALGVWDVIKLLNQKKLSVIKFGIIGLVFIIAIWELLYTVNSHILLKPLSQNSLIYSKVYPNIKDSLGFNQLDKYLQAAVLPADLALKRPAKISDVSQRMSENIIQNKTVYLFDESLSWFAYSWYIQRYQFYYGLPLIPLQQELQKIGEQNIFEVYQSVGISNIYFIYTVNTAAVDPTKKDSTGRQLAVSFANSLEEQGVVPVEIKNHFGEVAFKVYKIE